MITAKIYITNYLNVFLHEMVWLVPRIKLIRSDVDRSTAHFRLYHLGTSRTFPQYSKITVMTELEKMLSGQMYDPMDPYLVERRARARLLCHDYNQLRPSATSDIQEILHQLLGSHDGPVTIEPSFHCDYGDHIHVGKNFFANFNCVFLDVAEIRIGDRVMMATAVQLLTATHPIAAAERNSGRELGYPITIGDDVWLGGGVIVLPGVTIGDRAVIGSGSVVTKDIPADCVAVGNPCKVVKKISP